MDGLPADEPDLPHFTIPPQPVPVVEEPAPVIEPPVVEPVVVAPVVPAPIEVAPPVVAAPVVAEVPPAPVKKKGGRPPSAKTLAARAKAEAEAKEKAEAEAKIAAEAAAAAAAQAAAEAAAAAAEAAKKAAAIRPPIVLRPPPPPLPPGPHLELDQLQSQPTRALKVMAKDIYGMENASALKKHDLVCELIKRNALKNGTANGGGVLDIVPEGHGFLRSPRFNYLTCPEDIYVSQSYIRRYNLRKGDTIYGPIRPPKEKERFFALGRIDLIEGKPSVEGAVRPQFDLLTPTFPNRRIFLEGKKGDVSMRAMDLICPLGFGQRGLIVAPPRTGKTILLQKIANAVMENNPNAHLIMLLIDERPEEVTDMLRTVKGEIIASTFDETCERHVAVAEMVTERAKRLVENKVDVVILLDSITRLARAYNTMQPSSGKIMSGGVESNALQKPKRFFGAARNVLEGGSLTIIATALIETGSRMDDVIFEEFKGTGNMEVNLDRNLSDQRIFPAFNIARSGTRKEELLYHTDELPRIHALRRVLSEESHIEAMNLMLEKIRKTENNIEFLMALNVKR